MGSIQGFQIHRNKGGLPVVALNDVRKEVYVQQGIQAGLGEVGKPLAVIRVSVDSAVPVTEIVQVINEVDLHAITAIF